jgi:hypothetical protein
VRATTARFGCKYLITELFASDGQHYAL